ncbi:MAG TPA: polymer-forming cytoskeletal protein [Syntrophomonadaceae bacterium]|nr:polymer-forming cytoskeletal protein [Syntrophomonadaceae bacterium]
MLKRKNNSFQNIESLIGEGVIIKGNIASQGSMRVDGYIEGKMETKGDLVVGEKGHIKGELQVENLMLSGKIEGSVLCRQRCLINETGVILGDVSCSILSIEEGGTLQGASKMNRPSALEGPEGDKKDSATSRFKGRSVNP